jgi:hypothetical protein
MKLGGWDISICGFGATVGTQGPQRQSFKALSARGVTRFQLSALDDQILLNVAESGWFR